MLGPKEKVIKVAKSKGGTNAGTKTNTWKGSKDSGKSWTQTMLDKHGSKGGK